MVGTVGSTHIPRTGDKGRSLPYPGPGLRSTRGHVLSVISSYVLVFTSCSHRASRSAGVESPESASVFPEQYVWLSRLLEYSGGFQNPYRISSPNLFLPGFWVHQLLHQLLSVPSSKAARIAAYKCFPQMPPLTPQDPWHLASFKLFRIMPIRLSQSNKGPPERQNKSFIPVLCE